MQPGLLTGSWALRFHRQCLIIRSNARILVIRLPGFQPLGLTSEHLLSMWDLALLSSSEPVPLALREGVAISKAKVNLGSTMWTGLQCLLSMLEAVGLIPSITKQLRGTHL